MATRRTAGVWIGLAVAAVALIAGIVVAVAVRDDDMHGRNPDQVIAALTHDGARSAHAAMWSLDGSTLYVADDTGIDILSGSPLVRAGRLDSKRGWQVATWNQDRSLVVLSSNSTGNAEVWDLANRVALPDVDTGEAPAHPAWSPDGKDLVTTGADGTVVIREARTGRVSSTFTVFEPGFAVIGLAWPTTARVVAISTTRIASVDIATGKTMWSHSYAPSGMVAPSPDGTEVVIGQRLAHDHDVYSLAGGTVLGTVEIDSRALLAVDWSPDGRWLVAAGDDERPRLWDVVAAVTRDEYPTIAPYAAGGSWAPDSRRVALADAYDHRVMVVDVTGATADEDLSISTDVVLVATAWAPAGDRLAAIGRDGTVFAWEVTT